MTGPELQDWMEEQDFNNRELAEALGVHQMTVTKWRTGALPISYVTELALGNPKLYSKSDRRRRVRERSPSERVRRERLLETA